jgi:hypothetical protein
VVFHRGTFTDLRDEVCRGFRCRRSMA